jgi:RimJ/RimL family protein N-acetyltransferase
MQDASYIYHWERDDEVWRYDPLRPYAHSMWEFLPAFERNYVRSNGHQFWYLIENEQQTPIGTITYFNINRRLAQVEIGLGIGDKSQWGKGYGSEAITTLVRHLFASTSLARIYAETAVANRPARRSFARANFREVGQVTDPRSGGEPWILLEIWRPV